MNGAPSPALQAALASLRAGDTAGARREIDAALAVDPDDPRALHLSGEIAARAGDLDRALRDLTFAASRAGTPDVAFSLARAQWRAGHAGEARENARRAGALATTFPPAALLLATIESAAGNAAGARAALVASGAADAGHFGARDQAVSAVAAEVADGRAAFARWARDEEDAPALSFTVVACTRDEGKLARAQSAVAASDPRPVQWLVLRDARSLAEAYNRALAQATGEAIVFMHDDVEVLSPGLFGALSRALGRADVVGAAGTLRLAGPTVGWAGQEFTRGALAHGSSVAGHYDYSLLNWTDGLVPGMQGLDGCFLAATTATARQVGFDAATFDAFHFYDLDFALRASLAGARVAVASEVLLAHASRGSVSGPWEAQAARFLAKFPALAGTAARPSHFYAARLANAGQVRAMHREMRGIARLLAG